MKRPKNQQSLRLSKKFIVAGLFLGIPILMMIIGMFSPSFATFWWQVFASPMEGKLYLLFQFIPISFYLILGILAVFCVFAFIIIMDLRRYVGNEIGDIVYGEGIST